MLYAYNPAEGLYLRHTTVQEVTRGEGSEDISPSSRAMFYTKNTKMHYASVAW